METEKFCPNCRKPLPLDVPLGLCPQCLIKSGFPTETGVGAAVGRFVPPPVEEVAKLFPQFEILRLIGKGGMGAVYQARQPALDRFVALKVLPPAVACDPGFAERFNREARALARLSHPNIVVVYDFGKAGDLHYLVMEFVDGTNLREVEQAGKLSPEQALAIVPQICEALQFAHNEGIVHRDIKPENLLLDKKGRVKITDFGIAKIVNLEGGKVSLTGAKDVMGTPHYMAPEQIENPQAVDHRADIYSLGVVFYEMLTGELPLGKFAPPSKKVQVDVRLDEVVLHTLEKEPARRYQQVSQVKTDVETIATGAPPPVMGTASMAGTAPPIVPSPQGATSDKIILPAFLLAFFFGIFGAHRFYVGKIGTGFLQLFTIGGLGIWATIDWILILCKAFTDKQGRRLTNWWHTRPGVPGAAAKGNGGKPPGPPVIGGSAAGGSNAMVIAPALALMVAGVLKLYFSLKVLLMVFLGLRAQPITAPFFHLGLHERMYFWGPVTVFMTVMFGLIPALVILFGGIEMMRIRSYAWAMASAIVAIVFCSLVGLPAGMWALIVLLLPRTREKFVSSQTQAADAKWGWILGATAAAGLFAVLMMGIAVVLIRHHTEVRSVPPPMVESEQFAPSAPASPAMPAQPAVPAVPVSVAVPGVPPVSYQWNDNATNDSTKVSNAIVTAASAIPLAGAPNTPAPVDANNAHSNQTLDVGDSPDFSHSFDVAPGGKLVMNVDRGEIRISSSDQNSVEVRVERSVTRANDSDVDKILEDEHVVVKQTDNEISITAQNPPELNHSFFGWDSPNLNVSYDITVPRRFDAEAESDGGNIRVADLGGSAKIKSLGGRLECVDIDGDVDASTDGGDIYTRHCTGQLELRTNGGNITADQFSGPDIQASTDGGSVSADFTAVPKGDSELVTDGGNVTAHLPDNAAITLDAHTDGGGVRTDLSVQTQGEMAYGMLKGTLNGGGPTLKLQTDGGNIEILKQ